MTVEAMLKSLWTREGGEVFQGYSVLLLSCIHALFSLRFFNGFTVILMQLVCCLTQTTALSCKSWLMQHSMFRISWGMCVFKNTSDSNDSKEQSLLRDDVFLQKQMSCLANEVPSSSLIMSMKEGRLTVESTDFLVKIKQINTRSGSRITFEKSYTWKMRHPKTQILENGSPSMF